MGRGSEISADRNAEWTSSGSSQQARSTQPDTVCFFVESNLRIDQDSAEAVAETWARDAPSGAQVYFLVDENLTAENVPAKMSGAELVRIKDFDEWGYEQNPSRIHSYFRAIDDQLNTSFAHCQWISVSDPDAYIAADVVTRCLTQYNSSTPRVMGPIYGSWLGLFFHGHFTLYSRSGFQMTRQAADACSLTNKTGWADVLVQGCVDDERKTNKDMPKPEDFGRQITDNERNLSQNRILELIDGDIRDHGDLHCCTTDVHKLTAVQMREYSHNRSLQQKCDGCPWSLKPEGVISFVSIAEIFFYSGTDYVGQM